MQVFLVFALIIALIAVAFAVQNTALVTVSFLFWNFNHSLAVVILLAIFAGVLISLFVSLPGMLKRSLETTNQRKKIKELDSELGSTKIKLEALQQELEVYRAHVEQPAPVVELEPVTPESPSSNGFLSEIKAKLKH